METVHTAIGVTSVVAMLLVVSHSLKQLGGRVLEQTREPISDLVTRGGPVADQLTAVEGETPLVEGDRMDGACSVVQSIGLSTKDPLSFGGVSNAHPNKNFFRLLANIQ